MTMDPLPVCASDMSSGADLSVLWVVLSLIVINAVVRWWKRCDQ